jgi:hypothetical protein
MSYRQVIQAATKCSDDDAFEVEEMLRNQHGGTLDHLTRGVLTLDAKSAYKDLLRYRAQDPNWSPDPEMKAARQKRAKS